MVLKVLTNEERGGLKVVAFDKSPFKLFTFPRIWNEEDAARKTIPSLKLYKKETRIALLASIVV